MPELNVRYVADLARLALSGGRGKLYQEQLSHSVPCRQAHRAECGRRIEPSAHALRRAGPCAR
ncbi:MAG: hypothetical protein R3F31_20670 [Verrucomicrobiales bacterium]